LIGLFGLVVFSFSFLQVKSFILRIDQFSSFLLEKIQNFNRNDKIAQNSPFRNSVSQK